MMNFNNTDISMEDFISVKEAYEQGIADGIDELARALINDGKVSSMRVLKIKERLKEQKK